MKDSLSNLLRAGWSRTTKPIVEKWYPDAASIVLEKGEEALVHTYAVYTDSSDYPSDDEIVTWDACVLTAETLYTITRKVS